MPVTFSDLLDAAERRMQTDGFSGSLLQALLLQLAGETQAKHVSLTASSAGQFVPIMNVGQKPDRELPQQAVSIGQIVRQKLEDGYQLIRTAAQLAGDDTMTLSAICPDGLADEELFASVVEVGADLYRRQLLESHSVSASGRQQQIDLLARLHSTLDTDIVANTIATDGSALTGARTISVARRNGQHWAVTAATGVSHPNDRSDAIRQTISLIKAAAEQPSNGVEENDDHSTTKSTQGIFVRPLNVPADWKSAEWAAVFDFSDSTAEAGVSDRASVDLLCSHGAIALKNCNRYAATTVLNRLKRMVRKLFSRRFVTSTVVVCGIAACLFLLKTELKIEAYGELVPADRSLVFAPEDGTIEQVDVNDGSEVTQGQQLCVLSNEDLEVQMEELVGDLSATSARLASIEALKGQPGSASQSGLLSAEQLELREKSRSLTRQVQIMRQRMTALTMTAEMKGRVYGDRLAEMLTRRPVRRGQFLFEVANPKNDWQLELRIPEQDIRHVLNATDRNQNQFPTVRYALETSPEVTHVAQVTLISESTDLGEDRRLSTLVVVDVGEEQYSSERPGTGVVAYIECGRHRLGYVWFRKIIEFVQRNVWL